MGCSLETLAQIDGNSGSRAPISRDYRGTRRLRPGPPNCDFPYDPNNPIDVYLAAAAIAVTYAYVGLESGRRASDGRTIC